MLTANKQSIKVSKVTLLNKLRENLEIYKKQYYESLEDYKKAVKNFSINLEKAIESNNYNYDSIYFKVSHPVDYSSKYQLVIEMLEYSTDESIELDTTAFNSYIKNVWDWSNTFNSYSASLKALI